MERIVVEQISKLGQDPERLKKILLEASKQRRMRLADLQSERRRLEHELKVVTETLPPQSGDRDNHAGLETVQENIGHLQRRLAENNDQVLLIQQPNFEADQAAQVLATLEQVFGSLPQAEQARFIRSAVQRGDYDGGNGKLVLTLDPTGLVEVLEEQSKPKKEIAK
jgi:hypothetical protein